MLSNAQPSQNPLDYISPQAAIASGLDATAVYTAWSKGLAQYPTQQAALNAGIPAGVVTQLWTQSRQYVGAQTSFFGLSSGTLLMLGAGLLGFAALSGGRRRR
jgi:hypothetical protein